MPKSPLAMALAKVIIAAAWADGDLALDEVNQLKNLLAELGQTGGRSQMELNAQEWGELEIYLYSPVEAAERTRLVEELAGVLRGPADRTLALQALDQLVAADRVQTDAERAVSAEIRASLERADVGPLGGLGQLVRRALGVRASGPNREQFLDEFLRNRVYYAVRQRLGKAPEEELGIPADEARKLALAGGLLARVAGVDKQVQPAERERIVAALESSWGISHERAVLVTEVALAESVANLDDYVLTYEFASRASVEERVSFLDALFAVAAADGAISAEESAEISRITSSIRLEHEQFVAAKRRARAV